MLEIVLTLLISSTLLLLIVVGFHELGHFLAAKCFGVTIKRFSIGFGKVLLRKQLRSGTEFCFSLIPLGGYVSLLDSRTETAPIAKGCQTFDSLLPWKRLVILVAGPIFSFILPIVIYFLLFLVGFKVITPSVQALTPNSIAEKAGFKAGDTITRIGDYDTYDWSMVILSLAGYAGQKKTVAVDVKNSHGVERNLFLTLSDWRLTGSNPNPLKSLGIKTRKHPQKTVIQLPLFQALDAGMTRTLNYLTLNARLLYNVAVGHVSFRALSGPITLFRSAEFLFRESMELFLRFLALLSIAVGVANLLPIPGLDGGQIFLLLIEKLRGERLTLAFEVLMQRLAFAFLFVVFMQLIVNDLNRLAGV